MTPALKRAYDQAHRRYHDRRHIEDCLAKLEGWPGLAPRDRRLLTWAIWWHDAVYDPKASDNEARSAEMARRDLLILGATETEADEVARLILLTAGHQVREGDHLGEALVSIDLSILAAPPAEYDAYAKAVRAEYAHVSDQDWRRGRPAVLKRFLDAPQIFPDPAFNAAHEAQARANMAREIRTLQDGA